MYVVTVNTIMNHAVFIIGAIVFVPYVCNLQQNSIFDPPQTCSYFLWRARFLSHIPVEESRAYTQDGTCTHLEFSFSR